MKEALLLIIQDFLLTNSKAVDVHNITANYTALMLHLIFHIFIQNRFI